MSHDPRMTRPVTQVEVETRIARLCLLLEDRTDELDQLAGDKAETEADWLNVFHQALLTVAASPNAPGDAKGREAKAHRLAEDPEFYQGILGPEHPGEVHRRHLLAVELLAAAKVRIRATESDLSAQQSLLSAIRAQT